MTYNGFTNYETQQADLWITNEETTYHAMITLARSSDSEAELSSDLQAQVEDDNPLTDVNDLYSGLLNAAIREINFDELAAMYWADNHEDDEEEDEE